MGTRIHANRKKGKKHCWYVIAGALLFAAVIAATIFSAVEILQIRQLGATTEGRVIHNTIHGFTVIYEIDGRRFTQGLGRFEHTFGLRGYITLYYDPANPDRVTTGRLPILWMALSCFILLAPLAVYFAARARRRRLIKGKQ